MANASFQISELATFFERMSDTAKVVCVTGGTGFVAGHIINELLLKGYTVRTTVRDPSSSVTRQLKDTFPTVQFVEANILVADTLLDAFEGCDAVIHSASPVVLKVKDPMGELVEPAVLGTLNVLTCCRKAGIKEIILTASDSTIINIEGAGPSGMPYSSIEWNTSSTIYNDPYGYSKTLAERLAWQYVGKTADTGIRMCSVHPCVIIGPQITDRVTLSNSFITSMFNGSYPLCPPLYVPIVDVRDVAKAHVLLLENQEANGRYLIANTYTDMRALGLILEKNFPHHYFKIPTCNMPVWLFYIYTFFDPRFTKYSVEHETHEGRPYDTSPIQALGLTYTPMEKTVVDAALSMLGRGIVVHPQKRFVTRKRLLIAGGLIAAAVGALYFWTENSLKKAPTIWIR